MLGNEFPNPTDSTPPLPFSENQTINPTKKAYLVDLTDPDAPATPGDFVFNLGPVQDKDALGTNIHEELKRDRESKTDQIDKLRNHIEVQNRLQQVLATPYQVEQSKALSDQNDRIQDVMAYMDNWRERQPVMTVSQGKIEEAFNIGAALNIADLLEKHSAVFKDDSTGALVADFNMLRALNDSGQVLINLSDLSIRDFDLSKNIPLASTMRFFLEPRALFATPYLHADQTIDFTEIDARNRKKLLKDYDGMIKGHAAFAGAMTMYLPYLNPRDLYAYLDRLPAKVKKDHFLKKGLTEAANRAARLLDLTNKRRDGLKNAIFYPQTGAETDSLIEIAEKYIDQDFMTDEVIRLVKIPEAYHTYYRKARELANGNYKPDFYNKLAEAIKSYYLKYEGDLDSAVTVDDLPEIADIPRLPPTTKPVDPSVIQTAYHQLFSKDIRAKYQLDLEALPLDWYEIQQPKAVEISVPPNHHDYVRFNLQWINDETGESMSITLYTKIDDGSTDWSVLYSPTEPGDTPLLTYFSGKVAGLLQRAQAQYLGNVPQTEPATTAREQAIEDVYALRKIVRQEQREKMRQVPNVQATVSSERERIIHNTVVLPTETALAAFFKKGRIQPADQTSVLESIAAYNTEGKGVFARLVGKGRDGTPTYKLEAKIPGGGGGGIRVLMKKRETPGPNGDQFVPYLIKYRKNAYSEGF